MLIMSFDLIDKIFMWSEFDSDLFIYLNVCVVFTSLCVYLHAGVPAAVRSEGGG